MRSAASDRDMENMPPVKASTLPYTGWSGSMSPDAGASTCRTPIGDHSVTARAEDLLTRSAHPIRDGSKK